MTHRSLLNPKHRDVDTAKYPDLHIRFKKSSIVNAARAMEEQALEEVEAMAGAAPWDDDDDSS